MTNEEVIKQLKYCKSIHNGSFGPALKIAIKSLEQEPKTGQWIKFVVNGQHKIKCNKCDYTEAEYITHIRNYCPNCGAKMQEVDDDTREI